MIAKVDQTIFDSSKMLCKVIVVAGSQLVDIMQIIQWTVDVVGNNCLRRDDALIRGD